MKYFVYKLTYDTGAAPHVRDGLLSLAICKPRIRESAQVGDVIFGFAGRSRAVNRGERLIYVARVTMKLTRPGEYYDRPEFRDRLDCIYERDGAKLVWRPGSLFHENGTSAKTDLGPAPAYPRAIVLMSDDFRYLGAEGTLDYAERSPDLFSFVHEAGVGHRVLEPDSAVGRMLTQLKRDFWRCRRAGKVGLPTEPEPGKPDWTPSPSACGSGATRPSCAAQPGAASNPVPRRAARGTCG